MRKYKTISTKKFAFFIVTLWSFFWSVFPRIRTEYGENTDQKKRNLSRSEASDLIIKSRRSSSNSSYESAWGKYAGWCADKKINPFCSNTNQILEFLSQLFQNGLLYRTITNYRSGISVLHDHIQGKPVGNTPEFILWLLVLLIVDLHKQSTVLFGIYRQ